MIKKMLFFSILLPAIAFAADYNIVANNKEEVDLYYNVFNYIAGSFTSNSYLAVLKFAFIFGTVCTFIYAMVNKTDSSVISKSIKYWIIYSSIFSILFSSTSSVVVTAPSSISYCKTSSTGSTGQVIANVPTILAFSISGMNEIVAKMIDIASFMTPPNSYGNGSLISSDEPNAALIGLTRVLSTDISKVENFNADGSMKSSTYPVGSAVSTFIDQCVYSFLTTKGSEGAVIIKDLEISKNMWQAMGDYYSSSKMVSGIPLSAVKMNFMGEVYTCSEFYAETDGYIKGLMSSIQCSDPSIIGASLSLLAGGGGSLTEVPVSDFQQIALQAGMINSYAASVKQGSIGVSGSSIQGYIQGKSMAEQFFSKGSEAAMLASTLPIMQFVLKIVLIASFPFILAMSVMSNQLKIISMYLQTFIWVYFWDVTSTLINGLIMQLSASKLNGVYSLANGITMSNVGDILTTTGKMLTVSYILYISVPALTWLILKGSGTAFSSFLGGIASIAAKNATTDAAIKDVKELSETKALNSSTGQNFTFAEQKHYEANQAGLHEGLATASKMKFNDSLSEYEKYSSSAALAAFSKSMSSGYGKADQEATNATNEFYKNAAHNNGITPDISGTLGKRAALTDTGLSIATNGQASSDIQKNATFKSNMDHFSGKGEREEFMSNYPNFKQEMTNLGSLNAFSKESDLAAVGSKRDHDSMKAYKQQKITSSEMNSAAQAQSISASEKMFDQLMKNPSMASEMSKIADKNGHVNSKATANAAFQSQASTLNNGTNSSIEYAAQNEMKAHTPFIQESIDSKVADYANKNTTTEISTGVNAKTISDQLNNHLLNSDYFSSNLDSKSATLDALQQNGIYSKTAATAYYAGVASNLQAEKRMLDESVMSNSSLSPSEKTAALKNNEKIYQANVQSEIYDDAVNRGLAVRTSTGTVFKDTSTTISNSSGTEQTRLVSSLAARLNASTSSVKTGANGSSIHQSYSQTGERVQNVDKQETGIIRNNVTHVDAVDAVGKMFGVDQDNINNVKVITGAVGQVTQIVK